MSPFQCPLCRSPRYVVDAKVASQRLLDVYARSFAFDAKPYLPDDELITARCVQCDLRTHMNGRPGESGFYDHMQRYGFYYESHKPEFDYAIDQLVRLQPERVLDVGCGAGLFLERIAPGFAVKGSEYSERSLSTLREKHLAIDGPDDRYDFVVSFQVIEHVPDVHGFVKFCVDKLTPGGHLLIVTVNHDSRTIREGFDALDYPPHHLTQWSEAALKHVASLFGLEAIDYYTEPTPLSQYAGIVSARRGRIQGPGLKRRLLGLFGNAMDRVLAPYFVDMAGYPGMAHGLLMRKPSH